MTPSRIGSHTGNVDLAKRVFIRLGSLCLILAPLLSFVGWALPYESIGSFFQFSFSRLATDATASLDRGNIDEVFRYYLLPHYFIYASMAFYAGAGVFLGYVCFRKIPWHALIGSACLLIGAIYFVGVLGAFLSIPIGTVNQTNVLKFSFALCSLVFVGLLIFGMGMYKARLLPKLNSIVFLAGLLLIVFFPGLENWMALGSIMIVIGLWPMAWRNWRK